MPPTIFISAGEASGEHYGALLIQALKRRLAATGRTAAFVGMGGDRMIAAGLDCVVPAEEMAVMGITEVVRHLPRIYAGFRSLKRAIRTRRPDVAVLIDFPDIHFKLAKEFHRQGIPVIFFVSPQLWAWKKGRIKLVQRYVTRMLVIFPFEEPFYRERGVRAEFVGHPLADLPLPTMSRNEYSVAHGLNPAAVWIGLLPGSRAKEIRANLPQMLGAAQALAAASPERDAGMQFLIPLAPTLTAEQRAEVQAMIAGRPAGIFISVVQDARPALFHARASIVASGTATVEAALIGNPFVVVYRVSRLTYAIAKRVVTVPHVAMANLIAGKRAVPELIQDDFTAANIVQQIGPLLPDGPPRESMMEELKAVGRLLRDVGDGATGESLGAIERVARVVLELLGTAQR
jgi:lipid-A-disaccharide synthase